jgi:isoquinoline 1-oxidoreductase subunit alpha
VPAIKVNGEVRVLDIEEDTPLLWVLRDTLGLVGTKFGCGVSACGACTVHVNGEPVRSCSTTIGDVAGKEIATIESLATDKLHPVQQAWIDHEVPQCGYCQSGMIMATTALLAENPDPTDADIDAAITNICRCGTYSRIRTAIHAAAKNMREG